MMKVFKIKIWILYKIFSRRQSSSCFKISILSDLVFWIYNTVERALWYLSRKVLHAITNTLKKNWLWVRLWFDDELQI